MARRRREPPKVVHVARPDLGVGEAGELVAGKPPVLQVYWPAVEKYGYYLVTDLRRLEDRPTALASEP